MADPPLSLATSGGALEYPVGAFIAYKCNLSRIVKCVHELGIKRSGANSVTAFNPTVPSSSSSVGLDDVEYITPRDDFLPPEEPPAVAQEGPPARIWWDRTPPRWDQILLASDSSPLFAVHVVGAPSEGCLRELLLPIRGAAAAVCYAERLRVRDNRCAVPDADPAPGGCRLVDADHNGVSPPPTFIELFAGIGMFRLAGEAVGARCVFSSEIAPPACAVYEQNFHERPSGDISQFPADHIPCHDILTAGFPCQSFSCAGPQRSFADDRGLLFFEICRVLRTKKPKAFLLENVANIVHMEEGCVFATITSALRGCGYAVTHRVVDSALVVPQRRRRVYIVGFLNSQLSPPTPSADEDGGVNPFLSAFHWPQELCGDDVAPTRACVADILEAHPSHDLRLSDAQYDLVRRRGSHAISNLAGHARTLMGSYKRSYTKFSEFVPLHDNAAANHEEAKAPLRFYSVRECARLQGIPDSYAFHPAKLDANASYKLIGNAVSPKVVQPIMQAIVAALTSPADNGDGPTPYAKRSLSSRENI